jgi:hypothetical protein
MLDAEEDGRAGLLAVTGQKKKLTPEFLSSFTV